MLTLIDNNKKWQIMSFFLDNPTTEIHLRALSRRLIISATWISKIVKDLAKHNLLTIKEDKEKNLMAIIANRDNMAFKSLKRSYNLYNIYKSGLLEELIEAYNKPECVILFGSYSRGEDTEESDIDTAIITTKNIKVDLKKFEKMLKRNIRVMELRKGSTESEFMNTLANGIVLYGYLDIRK